MIHSTHLLARAWRRARPSARLAYRATFSSLPVPRAEGKKVLHTATISTCGRRAQTSSLAYPNAARSVRLQLAHLPNQRRRQLLPLAIHRPPSRAIPHTESGSCSSRSPAISGFLDLGIRGAVTRYIARFHAEGRSRASQPHRFFRLRPVPRRRPAAPSSAPARFALSPSRISKFRPPISAPLKSSSSSPAQT